MENTDWEQFSYDVIDGKAGGKVLWQPRILCWYSDKIFAKQSLGEFEGCRLSDIYKRLDICNRVYDYNACICRVVDEKKIQHFSRQISPLERELGIRTPLGEITARLRTNNSNGGEFFSKWWIETEEDLKIYTYYEQASDWAYDDGAFQRVRAEWGKMGAPSVFLPRTTIQHAYLDTMGVENTAYALADTPEAMRRYFAALNESHDRYIDVLNRLPIRFVNFGDNLHCALLPDEYFEEFILPAYIHRTEKLHKAGKFVFSHWDGDTKSILKYAKQTTLDGIEAITPKPQGDVTLEEVKEALGDQMFLLDGIAAILFAQPFTEEDLIRQTEEVIRLFAPKLILGISDEMASFGTMDRIRLVKSIVEKYNRSLQ